MIYDFCLRLKENMLLPPDLAFQYFRTGVVSSAMVKSSLKSSCLTSIKLASPSMVRLWPGPFQFPHNVHTIKISKLSKWGKHCPAPYWAPKLAPETLSVVACFSENSFVQHQVHCIALFGTGKRTQSQMVTQRILSGTQELPEGIFNPHHT